MKTLVAILLLLTSRPLWGWTVPIEGSGENSKITYDVLFDSFPLYEDYFSDFGGGLEKSEEPDVEGPFDSDDEDQDDGEGSGESDRVSSEGTSSSTVVVPVNNSISNPLYGMIPKAWRHLFENASRIMEEAFQKQAHDFSRLEKEVNRIVSNTLDSMDKMNGTTTNSTDVVEDGKGNKFEVETLIKKGDKNQTFVMETIKSIPPNANRTKRSNWFAERIQ